MGAPGPAVNPEHPAPSDRPRRTVVRATVPRPDRRPAGPQLADLQGRSAYGPALLRSLLRAQLATTIAVLAPAGALVALYPLLAVLFPAVADATVGPLPLAAVVLGGGIYPPLVALAFWYARRARRVEERFAEILEEG
jgi:Flp pilus assembly protein TadB